ncbi:MAG: hypothetical protein KGR98_03205, partial [Verrucomicrobia bacterium]|nr:hypothetical protein [Verrucomicrobiota bacterium]
MKTRRTNDESGIALVVTLILMAVALVMAVAFLAISRRAKGSVATQTNGTAARYAADAALAGAEAQIVATIMSGGTNTHGQIAADPCGFGLVVSTNDISTNAFSQPACVGFANVSYYYANGNVVGGDDFNQVLTNLYYDPRVPVMISSNEPAGRFYLDLNRNGKFDANGFAADVISNGVGVVTNGNSFHVGDPEWIGILEHPDAPYGPDNPAVARYAFIAVPVGNALDLNAIHNQAMVVMNNQSRYRAPVNPMTRGQDYFFRNQGVGSWELNLAAFLADLDTNQWGAMVGSGPTPPGYDANFYWYNYPLAGRGYQGYAFDDAFSLITNRYAANYDSLATNVFNGVGDIDYYNDGPLMTGFSPISETFYVRGVPPPWVGSDNTNHFFDEPDDLFDPAQSSAGFVQRLTAAGAAAATYDRYSYYRLLSQLGTDSDPDSGKMNLNYDNVDANGSVVDGAETNFISWTPLGFFTNAANRLLLAYTADWAANYVPTNNGVMIPVLNSNFWATFSVTNAFGVGDIPVLVSNRFVYTPAVQRLLQLAANMYDATTNNTYNGSPDWPDVFRPLFSRDTNGNVFITGYTNVYPMGQMNGYPVESTNGYPLALPVDVTSLPVNVYNMVTNVYGVPWIVGAKKGYPNFNKFQLQTIFSMTRKLQYTRTTAGPRITIKADPGDYTLSQELLLSV